VIEGLKAEGGLPEAAVAEVMGDVMAGKP